MIDRNHPLTRARAVELARKFMPGAAFQLLANVSPEDLTEYAREAFDAGREHERKHTTPTLPAEVTDKMVEKALNVWFFHTEGAPFGELSGYPSQSVRGMSAALKAALAVAAPADPHHDPRPWQDCTREDIRAGDLVEARSDDVLYVGVAHHKDNHGDWWTEGGYPLTHGDRWPLRHIPAPTPPAEVVELPTEPGSVLRDVYAFDGSDHAEAAVLARDGAWYGDWTGGAGVQAGALDEGTLPDGTRARRDGEREDGTPRFVKEDA